MITRLLAIAFGCILWSCAESESFDYCQGWDAICRDGSFASFEGSNTCIENKGVAVVCDFPEGNPVPNFDDRYTLATCQNGELDARPADQWELLCSERGGFHHMEVAPTFLFPLWCEDAYLIWIREDIRSTPESCDNYTLAQDVFYE